MKRQTEELEDGEEIEDECITSFNADDWDDSALIEAWDLAKNEYLKHHEKLIVRMNLNIKSLVFEMA